MCTISGITHFLCRFLLHKKSYSVISAIFLKLDIVDSRNHDKNNEEYVVHIKGTTCRICTSINPFKLVKYMNKF